MNKSLHTPEGVRDIYNEEYQKRHLMQDRIMRNIASYGYENILTPTLEYFDVFGNKIGTTPSKDLYKFFDREGNTLVLRPDFTPSVARAAVKYITDSVEPLRLCYEGNVFTNPSNYQGRFSESTQMGAEFIGDDSLDADSEIIAMACGCLSAAGLKEFQISIGHSSVFASLVEAAGFDEEEAEELKGLILNKNFFGVEEFLDKKSVGGSLRKLFGVFHNFYDSPEEWADLKSFAKDFPAILDVLLYFEKLYDLLQSYDVERHISFEMGLLSPYQYYTGVIFSGYTYGSGEPIIKGGRYDKLLSNFSKDAPAIGFAVLLDSLMMAVEHQKIPVHIEQSKNVILYTKENRTKAIATAKRYRDYGKVVVLRRIVSDKHLLELKEQYKNFEVEVVE